MLLANLQDEGILVANDSKSGVATSGTRLTFEQQKELLMLEREAELEKMKCKMEFEKKIELEKMKLDFEREKLRLITAGYFRGMSPGGRLRQQLSLMSPRI